MLCKSLKKLFDLTSPLFYIQVTEHSDGEYFEADHIEETKTFRKKKKKAKIISGAEKRVIIR